MSHTEPITSFEHQKLTVQAGGMSEEVLQSLEHYYGSAGTPYFDLIHKGVRFNHHVGVIQVGSTVIEVLPKVDQLGVAGEATWKKVLIEMLRITQGIKARSTSESELAIKRNSILDLYTELFVEECETLSHRGLVKQYVRRKENSKALKGRLDLSKHIRQNLVHKERFLVEYDAYDQNHLLNQILKKTLEVLAETTRDGYLINRIRNQQLYFMGMDNIRVHEDLFSRISLNRQTQGYKRALNISKMILMNYHPDITMGRENVLALMFNMNELWERFIAQQIRKGLNDQYQVNTQFRKLFWTTGKRSKYLIPDIHLQSRSNPEYDFVIDTKWKIPKDLIPTDQDLRQIFAYNSLFNTKKGILLYPGTDNAVVGQYRTSQGGTCDVLTINIMDEFGEKLVLGEKTLYFLKKHLESEDYWVI